MNIIFEEKLKSKCMQKKTVKNEKMQSIDDRRMPCYNDLRKDDGGRQRWKTEKTGAA